MKINDKDLEGLVNYAKTQCQDKCPAERDPNICLALIDTCECLKLEMPACCEETNGFSKKYFLDKIKEIEKRRGKKIQEVLADVSKKGIKTLEDDIDRMDAEFALDTIKAIDARAKREASEKGK
ncbi:MAG: hypothetical protein LUP94_03465 [Candidatus Methanomethylicus sp.]|nr:hypothetical protein [Candidatus Methanomethylicus sp.]